MDLTRILIYHMVIFLGSVWERGLTFQLAPCFKNFRMGFAFGRPPPLFSFIGMAQNVWYLVRIWASVGFRVSWCLLVHIISFQNKSQELTNILTCSPFNAYWGQAQNSAEAVPFVVTDDRGLLVQVDASGKEVRSLAEIVCWVTKTRGVCDVKLKNHTLTQKLQVGLY